MKQSQNSSFTHICWLPVPETPETINTYRQQHAPVLLLAPILLFTFYATGGRSYDKLLTVQ